MAESSTLFADKAELNLRSCIMMVEAVLIELGHTPASIRLPTETAGFAAGWAFAKRAGDVRVTLIGREGENYIRAFSTVVRLPERAEDLAGVFQHLLELNADAVRGAAFALTGGDIVLTSERPTIDLDRSEVVDMIRRIEQYKERYESALLSRFTALRPPASHQR